MSVTSEDIKLITALANDKLAPCHIARKFNISTEQVRNICKAQGAFVGGYKSRMRDYAKIDAKIRHMVKSERYSQKFIAEALGVDKARVLAVQVELGYAVGGKVNPAKANRMKSLAAKVSLLCRDGMTIKDACKVVGGISPASYGRHKKSPSD
jgi:hypothetical protein